MISIRLATRADVGLVASLIRGLAEYGRLADQVTMTEELLERHLFEEPRAAEVVIAEVDGETAGFALFFSTFSTFLGRPGIYLEDLFVLPDYRGHGVGLALLRHLAGLCRERGCGRLEWSVLDWNVDAIRFYERLGARPTAGWTVYRLAGPALERLATIS